MMDKGFETEIDMDETLNLEISEDEPLKNTYNRSKKVDINVLKARIQKSQNKENKKNIIIFTFFLLALGALGIYLSV